jgi:geranylgeranyl pyrophosphate synthase
MAAPPLTETLAPWLALVEPALQRAADAFVGPDDLVAAMRHALRGGGKRMRPCMTLAACAAAGGRPEDALAEGVALELVHTYSLVHDDLPAMDNDLVRRGLPTVHAQFGHAMGILAGDALLTSAFEQLGLGVVDAAHAHRRLRALVALTHASGSDGMVGGQVLDIAMRAPTRDGMRAMHAGKTGALFVAACRMGAIAAGATPTVEDALSRFGAAIGRAFQVGDDIEDLLELGQAGGDHEAEVNWAAAFGVLEAHDVVAAEVDAARHALTQLPGPTAALHALADWTLERARAAAAACSDRGLTGGPAA